MKKFCPDCNTAFYSEVGYCDACGRQFEVARLKVGLKAPSRDKQLDQLLYVLSVVAAAIGVCIPFFVLGR